MPFCQVCSEIEAKYKCPACSIQTCSLECVRVHKKDQRCNGKRPRSDHIPISEFNDATLHRGTLLYRCRSNARPELLRKRDKLKSECYQRGIHLKLMPHVFSLAQSNSSTIRNRKDEDGSNQVEIMWKVDWKFLSSGKLLSDTCVSESKTLVELISRFIDNTWKLGPSTDLFSNANITPHSLEIFLINYQNQEVKMDPNLTLRESMKDQAILEYPTFIIRERIDEVVS